MCPTLSISRWIFLLCLPVVMLVAVQKARSSPESLGLPCCHKVITQEVKTIQSCFEQKPRYGCRQHAFLIINKRHKNNIWCIDPNSEWLKDKIEKGELKCPPVISV